VFFLVILSIQCKIRRDRPAELWRSTGRSRSTGWQPLLYSFSMRLILLPASTLRKHIVKIQKLAKMTTTSSVYACF